MKQPKRLTRNQKILLDRKGLKPGQFLLIGEDADTMTLIDKGTGTKVTVSKRT